MPPNKLSVIIAHRNQHKFLREAVLSVLREKIPGLEVIVVDDASSPSAYPFISDLPIKWVPLSENKGQAFAQNRGWQIASGRYVTFLDSDDLLAPGGLRQRFHFLITNPNEKVVAGEVAGVLDAHGSYLGEFSELLLPHYERPYRYIVRESLSPTCAFPSYSWLFMYEKKFLESLGGFDISLLCSHDNDLFYRVIQHGPIPFIPVPIAFYRLHEQNRSVSLVKGRFERSRIAKAETLFTHLQYGVAFH